MKPTRALCLTIASLVLGACGGGHGAPPFHRDDYVPVQGWILLDADRAHVSEVLERAASFGVTQVQLSHDLIMDVEQITEDATHAVFLRDIAQEAKGYGLEVMFWAHELTQNRMFACFHADDPLWDERRETYTRAFEIIPELDGLVLMFGSAAPDPWFAYCQCDDPDRAKVCEDPTGQALIPELENPPPAQRVKLVVDTVADVTEALGKQLYIRTFIHSPEQLQWVGDGLRLVADRAFAVMSKPVPQDFEPYYPHNALIGTIGAHPHVTEFDLAGEYWGQARILNPEVSYVTYRFRYLWAHQGIGTVSRIERGSSHTLGTPNGINLFAVSALMDDPTASPDDLYEAWLAERYGLPAGSAAAEAFARVHRLSWEATRKRHYVLGFWALEKGSELPTEVQTAELYGRAISKYDEGFDDLFARLQEPTESTLRDLFQEGQEAVLAAQAAEASFASVRDALSTSDASDWSRRLRHQTLACRAWLWAEEALWGDKLYKESGEPTHRAWLEHAIDSLAAVGQQIEAELGDVSLASPERIAALVAAFRERYPAGEVTGVARDGATLGLPEVLDRSATEAHVRFTVDRPATCELHTGTLLTHTPEVLPGDGAPALEHEFWLTGLTPDRLHLIRLVCDVQGAPEPLTGGDWYLWTRR